MPPPQTLLGTGRENRCWSPDSSLLTALSRLAAWKKALWSPSGQRAAKDGFEEGLGVRCCGSPRAGSHPWTLSRQRVGRGMDTSSTPDLLLGSISKFYPIVLFG